MIDADIPILDSESPDFKDELAFNIWSTQSCSDFRNDRERPYDGQPWTDNGLRGQTEVKGLTFRDIKDCLIKAILMSAPNPATENDQTDEFLKCFDFSTDPPTPTQYLKDNQEKFISYKVELGTWRPQDVYKVDANKIDLLAVAQNLSCEMERMMGIFPNIPKDTQP